MAHSISPFFDLRKIEVMPQEKFIDYYEILQVSPIADSETIERVFRLLAKRYHPDNQHTSNKNKFNLVIEAHGLLTDPEKRAAYDVRYDEQRIQELGMGYHPNPSEPMGDEKRIRFGLLSELYHERKKDPSNPGVGTWQLERVLGWPEKVLAFHIWYLIGKKWIERLETGQLSITPDGVDIVEESNGHGGSRHLLEAPRQDEEKVNPSSERR